MESTVAAPEPLQDTHDVVVREGRIVQVRSRATGRALRVSRAGKVFVHRADGSRAWLALTELCPPAAGQRSGSGIPRIVGAACVVAALVAAWAACALRQMGPALAIPWDIAQQSIELYGRYMSSGANHSDP